MAICSGQVCAEYVAKYGNTEEIRVWADQFIFYGHFELQTANHKTWNSPDETWHVDGAGHMFVGDGGNGQYVAYAWAKTGVNSYTRIGTDWFGAGF